MTLVRQIMILLTVSSAVAASTGCSAPGKGEAFSCAEGGIVGWGDSLTYSLTKTSAGWGRAKPTWLETLGEDLGLATKNLGVPSQGSAEIAVRQGGLKPLVTIEGDRLPAGTTEASIVTAISPVDGWTSYKDAGTMKMHGALAGVPGTLQHDYTAGVEAFAFVPDSAPKSDVAVPAQTPFIGDEGDGYRDCVQLIWAGTNNTQQPAAITRDIASMVEWIAEPKRYFIIGTIPEVSTELSQTYGRRYIDLRGWLISDGLSAAGVAPAEEDRHAEQTRSKIPPSLRVDAGHFTQAAYTAIGHYLATVVKPAL